MAAAQQTFGDIFNFSALHGFSIDIVLLFNKN